MNYPYQFFSFGKHSSLQHEAGNLDCPVCDRCWPKRCKCGGLVHTQSGDSSGALYEGEWTWNEYACDRCGDKYSIIEDSASPDDIWKESPAR